MNSCMNGFRVATGILDPRQSLSTMFSVWSRMARRFLPRIRIAAIAVFSLSRSPPRASPVDRKSQLPCACHDLDRLGR
jgi:hypothetical protein